MEYLEFSNLDWINQFLNYVSFGDYCINGSLEDYSCKHTGTDKKLSFSLDQDNLDYLGQSADSDPPSPSSILSSRSRYLCSSFIMDGEGGYWVMTWSSCTTTRKLAFAVQAHRFFREEDWTSVKQTYDTYMFEVSKFRRSFFGECDSDNGGIDLQKNCNTCNLTCYRFT
ncbi:hypothetical protein MKW92_053837, partial [Papaver armeniacum]